MAYTNHPHQQILIVFFLVLFLFAFTDRSLAHNSDKRVIKRRALMGIKETPNGGNLTFDCSPSGPCIPCSSSEKAYENYRCGETGYRIRLKCEPIGSDSQGTNDNDEKKTRSTLERIISAYSDVKPIISSSKQRTLLGDASKSVSGSHSYVNFRSCIPAVSEEKLSVLGFEALMMGLLISSGSFIYFRRKKGGSVATGFVRLPTNSRF